MSDMSNPAGSTGGAATTPIHAALADLPAKVRVHALAKLLDLSSKDIITALSDLGEEVRGAQSSVSRDVALKVADVLIGAAEVEADPVAAEAVAQPEPEPEPEPEPVRVRRTPPTPVFASASPLFLPPEPVAAPVKPVVRHEEPEDLVEDEVEEPQTAAESQADDDDDSGSRRRRRGRRRTRAQVRIGRGARRGRGVRIGRIG